VFAKNARKTAHIGCVVRLRASLSELVSVCVDACLMAVVLRVLMRVCACVSVCVCVCRCVLMPGLTHINTQKLTINATTISKL